MSRERSIMLSYVSALFLSTFILSGCVGKEELDLPEGEMRQLQVMDQVDNIGVEEAAANNGANKAKVGDGTKFYVYAGKGYFKNHFIASGWMGDYGDIKINDGCRENPYSRNSCIRIDYTARKKQDAGWSGIYWQDPANNWGNMPGGYDLSKATKLTFYAKGEKGGELVTEFKMGGIQGAFSDSTAVSIGPIALTPEWQKYTIDLEGEDLSQVIGGFAFVVSEMENPEGIVFYLDEIAYE